MHALVLGSVQHHGAVDGLHPRLGIVQHLHVTHRPRSERALLVEAQAKARQTHQPSHLPQEQVGMQRASVVGHVNYPWREVDDSGKEWDEEFSLTGAESENKSINRTEGLDRLSSVAIQKHWYER